MDSVEEQIDSYQVFPERDLEWTKHALENIVSIIGRAQAAAREKDSRLRTELLVGAWDLFESASVPLRTKIELLLKNEIIRSGDQQVLKETLSDSDFGNIQVSRSAFSIVPGLVTAYSPSEEELVTGPNKE